MITAPKALRTQIGIFGRRNSGKSSLLNALTGQEVSLVSEVPGTTTDPVEKSMEMHEMGPVLFIDTAGIDDEGALGGARVNRTRKIIERVDIAVLVVSPGKWGEFELGLLDELSRRNVTVVGALNKNDIAPPDSEVISELERRKIKFLPVSALTGSGTEDLRSTIAKLAAVRLDQQRPLLADLVEPGSLVLKVIPIDAEAPRGRLLMVQVQAIREMLDHKCASLVLQDTEIEQILPKLAEPPALIVVDSSCLDRVSHLLPSEVPLTTYSILMARFKGNFKQLVEGTLAARKLKPGDKVLIAEACSHHAIKDDIGREQIPRWLRCKIGGELEIDFVNGHDFPENIEQYKLVVHCGGCMLNRKEIITRLENCQAPGVPVSNYGLLISDCQGMLERCVEVFPEGRALLAGNDPATVTES
jgi:[FeFe] hydrogenase H-cluster maturation GTPase HydF